ncbi:MAG TPA: DNRLRE domain-containing protein, partial [Jatrophihabitans sp.]|nr:DNRLRE domain-containing protein [Jatrophihabitans sp.]
YTAGNGSLAPGGYVPLSPTRLVDTRYGIGLPQAKLAPGSTTAIQVGGLVGVPTDASAVFVMLTAITTGAAGYFSPYPAGATRPANVSLNYLANSSTIAGAAVDLGTGGQFNLWIGTAGTAIDVIVDVVGYYSATPGAGAAFTPASARVYDSRIAPEVALSASGSRTVPVAGVAGVPAVSAGIGAFAFSAQIVHSGSGVGYLTMAPGDQSSGAVAAVFFSAGSNVRSDLVVVPAGSDGTVTLVNSSPDPINVILDVEGWFSLPPPLVTSLYFLPSQAIPSAVAESAADFQWQPADPGISSYSYSEDGGAAVAVPAAQTALAWYPSATGPHTLSVRGILANGVMTPPAIFSFTVAPPVAPSVPAFLATDLGRVDGDLISGVVDGNGASEITANFYVTDASGNPLGASSSDPYGSAQITAGQRASLLIPAAALTSGATYHWTMEACAAGACSARTADQSFVASAPPSAPTPAATTSVTLAATSGSSAPIGTTACAGAPCQPTVDDRLRVGDQGDGQLWRGYLTFNLSTVPAGARLTSAVLTLGPPTTTAANPVAGVGFVPLANPPAAGATGVVLAGLAEVDGGFSATGTNPSADITSLVQGWLDGDHPNGGLAVQASSETTGAGVSFPSPTASSGQPSLVVQYEAPTIPDPPTALTVRGGNAGLLVTWAAPQQEGSSKGVDHYLVTATAGSSTLQLTTAASYALLGGLTNGASYSVTVQAVNSLGASAGMTASGAPQAVANGSTLLACALSYQQARDQLQAGTANTASAALTGSSCSSSLTTRLSLEAPNLLSLRQLEATEGHPATADGSAQLSDGLALPAADGGVDVWAPLSRSTDETGSTGTPNLSSQLLLHYGPDNSLLSSYAADAAWTPLTAGTSPNGVLTSDQAALADQTNSLPPAIPGVATGTPAVPQGIAQPQYKHTINRTSAANWAIAHYKDPHYNQPDNCTDFISRALHFGGGMAYNYHHQPAYSFYSFPGTFFWFPFGHAISDDNAWFNGTSGNAIKQRWDGRNWTASYNTAADLMTFLSRNPGQWITYFGDARPGDVVFYAWTPLHGKYRTVNHVGIVSWYSAPDWDAEFWTAAQNADYAYRSIWDALASIRNDEQPGTSPAIYIFRPYSSSN